MSNQVVRTEEDGGVKTGVSRSIWMGTVGVLWLGASGPSHAHHGFASHFDPFSEAEIEGIVTEYQFINPHVLIHLQVTAPDGEAEPWVVESAGVTTFYREGGLSSDSLRPGDFVRIRGHPSRHGLNEMRLNRIVLPNGEELQRTSNLLRVPFLEHDGDEAP
ncbi:MAG: DUF6152 family protein [Rhodospirillaceae bacterium]|nr:DUF6152 family protein [Rhodospirillaceae bacterium]